jgi:acyl-CoA synthetase (AMP-forming)/AMP-acid ligase II
MVGLRRTPGAVCVLDPVLTLTFAQVDERASRLLGALRAAGLQRGDRIALLAHNRAEHLELMVAAQRGGFVLVPLNWRLTVRELAGIVADCTPALLVHAAAFAETAADLKVSWRWQLDEDYAERLAATPPAPREPIDPGALCEILYTSGTTGMPKGAMVSNRGHLARMCTVALDLLIGPGHVFLQVMPMFHIMVIFTHTFAFRGAKNVILPRFDDAQVFRRIGEHQVTHTALVPTAIDSLVASPHRAGADCSSLVTILYGASPITPGGLRRALASFDCGFHQIYGMTEVGTATILGPAEHDPQRQPDLMASAGRDMSLVKIDIVGPDGHPCPDGRSGEIVVSGPGVTDGYWSNPAATAAVLQDGWLHSGDIGRRDKQGYIYVTDRLKDIIITGGENVSPREVEAVLEQHPDVRECAVIGLPDQHYVERVHAVLVMKPGCRLDESSMRGHCAQRLAGYKCPRSYATAAALPRNAVGKLLRKDLRSAVNERLPARTGRLSRRRSRFTTGRLRRAAGACRPQCRPGAAATSGGSPGTRTG